jgi:hypothetical protein
MVRRVGHGKGLNESRSSLNMLFVYARSRSG